MSCVWMLQRGHSGDGCVLASTLCKYDLRKRDLFVLSWARVRQVRRGSLSSELLMCGGGVRNILLLPLVTRCLEKIDVCIWHMFVFMSVVLTAWGSVGMFVVLRPLLKIVFFSLGVLKYVVFSVCIVRRGAVGACVSGSSQCCVLHDLQFVNTGRGCNRRPYRRGILQSRSHNCFIGSHECLLLFTPSCCGECFYDL